MLGWRGAEKLKLTVTSTCVLILLLANHFIAAPAVEAQACGCASAVVIVTNREGDAVKGATVQFINLRDGSLVQNCKDKSPAKRSGSGYKVMFYFSAYGNGGPGEILLRVTAPGYNTFEERNTYLNGCYQRFGVALSRRPGRRRR